VWKPSRSYSVFLYDVHESGGPEYGLLGPFSEEDVLRRVRVFWWTNLAQAMNFGASLGQSAEASSGAYQAGLPVLTRSQSQVLAMPQVTFRGGATSHGWFELPLGVRVTTGSRYVVCRVTASSDPAKANFLVTADVVGFGVK
jgi:hypothetical protein